MRNETTIARAGFTLIEIMVVVIVLAVVSAMIVPNLHGTAGGVRLAAAARQVADLLDYGYQSALATGRVHAVMIDPDGRRMRMVAEPPAAPEEESKSETKGASTEEKSELIPVGLPTGVSDRLPDGVLLTQISLFDDSLVQDAEGGGRILFFPDGTTEFAALRLSIQSGESIDVEINGLSGTIGISRPAAGGEEEAGESEGAAEESEGI